MEREVSVIKNLEVMRMEPDELNLACTAVIDVLYGTTEWKISVLEQCLEYERMTQAYAQMEKDQQGVSNGT